MPRHASASVAPPLPNASLASLTISDRHVRIGSPQQLRKPSATPCLGTRVFATMREHSFRACSCERARAKTDVGAGSLALVMRACARWVLFKFHATERGPCWQVSLRKAEQGLALIRTVLRVLQSRVACKLVRLAHAGEGVSACVPARLQAGVSVCACVPACVSVCAHACVRA
eukprot:2623670-Pleurochrysis_carterae.AAC.1